MRVGFIGAGNMAGGLARGWAAAGGETGAPEGMLFADADPAKAEALAKEVGGEALAGNVAVADGSDLVVLAVKPNVLDEVAPDLIQAGTPTLSILAGTTLETLHRALPGIDLVRVMPNLGAQLRQAVLCVVYAEKVGGTERERVGQLLSLLGDVIELDEGLIDAATAIMGCSPGYLALMAEVLVEAGVREGLTEEQALRMVARSMSATGGLLDLQDPGALKRAVASPGGMTEAGLNALEEHRIQETLNAAIDASLERVRK
ncbi:MAG TPA: pyrroline-5-carboxylate reductase [Solirubrobacterales bacterium]|nr:pyrroline-5-carboxylate reductase [Solirubrobacterales bacterium]